MNIFSGRFCYLSSLLMVLVWASAFSLAYAQQDPRAKRPMKIHQVKEMGLEIWTELDPLWTTDLVYQGQKPLFLAQTPPMVYPPVAMMIVSFPGMTAAPDEMESIALEALRNGAVNFQVEQNRIDTLKLSPARYGELQGYETQFTGVAQGDTVDVKAFVGNKPGKGPVLLQLYTLEGKLPHVAEQVRRSWQHVKYLN